VTAASQPPPLRVLLVDDDERLCALMAEYLAPFGYAADLAHDGRAGLARALAGGHTAVILDVMLPGLNGFEVLRELRKKSDVPVLMLTAVSEEADRVAGLEMGADDYLPKPFSSRELLARLRAIVRRSVLTARLQADAAPAPVSVGGLWIDPRARTASVANQPLSLTPIEFELLLALARNAGWVRSREQLLMDVADRDFETLDRSIDVHVSSLRKKLGDDPRAPVYIETVRGAGYRMLKPGTR
jgi:DNA-binding response OmpR family regulator